MSYRGKGPRAKSKRSKDLKISIRLAVEIIYTDSSIQMAHPYKYKESQTRMPSTFTQTGKKATDWMMGRSPS